jgi:hypothetical protein
MDISFDTIKLYIVRIKESFSAWWCKGSSHLECMCVCWDSLCNWWERFMLSFVQNFSYFCLEILSAYWQCAQGSYFIFCWVFEIDLVLGQDHQEIVSCPMVRLWHRTLEVSCSNTIIVKKLTKQKSNAHVGCKCSWGFAHNPSHIWVSKRMLPLLKSKHENLHHPLKPFFRCKVSAKKL